jgi:hypothetical protein
MLTAECKYCPICKKKMLPRILSKYYNESPFPLGFYESQLKSVGIVLRSDMKLNDNYICIECSESGKAAFDCYLCKGRKSSEKKQESFGIDPTDYLCKDCYNSVPAAQWDKICGELHKDHQYDYE